MILDEDDDENGGGCVENHADGDCLVSHYLFDYFDCSIDDQNRIRFEIDTNSLCLMIVEDDYYFHYFRYYFEDQYDF
ncbi:hypothetical protein QR98_0022610 [Sarcoptes scabiei]|uniref:Uncharacterized protein n=1 Tax=Sarcoptes scabiei TaxID=52283 RepID=A0A131ZYE2_SARSC|nr:hypothetical protein QR98_0022610 [Sarcoptes scabiei]